MLPDYRFVIASTFATVLFVVLSFELLALIRLGHMPPAVATIEQRRFADERPIAPGALVIPELKSEPAVVADQDEPPQISAEERVQLTNLIALSAGVAPKERGSAQLMQDRTVALAREPHNGSRSLEPDPLPVGGPLAEPPQITGSIGPVVPVPRSAADARREQEQAEAKKRRARAIAAQRARAQAALAAQREKAKQAQAQNNPFSALFGGAGGN